MTLLAGLLLAAAALYGVLVALMYVFQRRLMYFRDVPRVIPAQAGFAQAEEIRLTASDGEKLMAWHVAPRGSKPVVLYFQGNACGLDMRVGRFQWLTADGSGLVALCYRGYGGSSGSPSETGLIRDALAAYDFAAARYGAARLVPFGESLGTAVAVALAAERPVGGLILDAPFTSAADVGAVTYPFVPVRWLIKDAFRSDRRIGQVRAPLLVLHGGRDRVVPIRFGERLFALASEPKRFVRFAEGAHVDLDDHGAAAEIGKFLTTIKTAQ
jgi:uncharacterized protein